MLDDFCLIPSFAQHALRNDYNTMPAGQLTSTGTHDKYKQKIYHDEQLRVWRQLKWYNSIFHNPIKNIKLVYYDETPDDHGSSEVVVPKKYVTESSIPEEYTKMGSYNYRDFRTTGRILHFFADVFPNIFYCKCVGN